jgi:hypothetical protein
MSTAREMSGTLSIPKSISHLRVAELPASVRLQSMFVGAGVRRLGDLNGRSVQEFLEQKHCGVATIAALQQLLQQAIAGEFDDSAVEQGNPAEALLNLIELAIERLSDRYRHLLLERVGAAGGRRPLTHEQLAQQHGLTNARIGRLLIDAFSALRKTFGPRIPRLLDLVRTRCFSNVCPLTPELLRQWAPEFRSRLHLSTEAHVRIIGELDENTPAWPYGHELRKGEPDEDVCKLAAHVATIARQAGGYLTLPQAYRRLKTQRRHRSLTVPQFLLRLKRARRIRIEFDKPQQPVIRSFRRLIHRRRSPD